MLTVDVDQPATQFPEDGCRCRHTVDPAGAFALRRDLPAEHQFLRALVPCLFQTILHRNRHLFKCGTDHSLCRTGADQIFGGTVAKDGIDGVDQNGLARTGLAGKNIQPRLEMNFRLLDDRNIFNLQAA